MSAAPDPEHALDLNPHPKPLCACSSPPPRPRPSACQVRLPDGSRQGRRFRRTDPLQSVFDFVDVKQKDAPAAPRPGTYSLVAQFPRRTFADGAAGSLQDAGFTTDTALFLDGGVSKQQAAA